MVNDVFRCKTETSFMVKTYEDDYSIVTDILGIEPTRGHNKGKKIYSKFSANPAIMPHGLWTLSIETIDDHCLVPDHIKYFKSVLGDKSDAICNLRAKGFETMIHILIHAEGAGSGFDLYTEHLQILNSLADCVSWSFVAVEEI